MKTIVVMFVVIFTAFAGMAQNPESISIDDVEIVPAQFTGAEYNVNHNRDVNLLTSYLCKCINYPEEAIKHQDEGTIVAKFTVNEKGQVSNIVIVNSVSPEIDQEFTRALNSTSSMWKPAMKGGDFRDCYKEVSLTFSLVNDPEVTREHFRHNANIYYMRGSEILLKQLKYKKAENYFDLAMKYMPNDGSLLYLRGICRYERGNLEGANEDWQRYSEITGLTCPPQIALDEKQFKGVEAFAQKFKDE